MTQYPAKLPATPHQCIGQQFQDHDIHARVLTNYIIFIALRPYRPRFSDVTR